MCAISGIVKFGGVVSVEELRIMDDAMIQRGPDDCGHYIDNSIGLGHRRLSIIDIENGKQPMQIDDDKYDEAFDSLFSQTSVLCLTIFE